MDLKKDEPCPHCGRYANRGVTVDAVIIRDGKLLLIKRGAEPHKGRWALPGGYVGWDESAEEAMRRETKEEVGLTVTSERFVGFYSKPERHPRQCINAAYLVTVEGEAKAGDDAQEFKWFDLDALPDPLAFDHKDIIADAVKLK